MRDWADKSCLATGWGHDIRTHLNVLLSAVGMIETGRLSPEKSTQYLAMIRQNALAMLRLVNHLLDAKTDTADGSPDLISVQIDGMLQTIVETIRPFVESRGLELLFDVKGPINAQCDVEMLERVLYNLLSNAVKFTDSGGFVYLSAKQSGNEVEINISDTGRGLTAKQLERLRGDPPAAEDVGMGLHLVKTLTARMGGTIACTSREHIGTTFYLRIPAGASAGQICTTCDASMLRIEMACLDARS